MSCLIPLMETGFVDWVISTGANLYHDAHFALGLAMHRGTPNADDVELRDKGDIAGIRAPAFLPPARCLRPASGRTCPSSSARPNPGRGGRTYLRVPSWTSPA